ncbi:MAG: hypothetical protein ACP5KM_03220 [Conexivisphaera sp.]
MRRRAQASIIAALFVLVALAILAVGFANVLMAQQNYAAQFQQSVQTDQVRSAESLTITGYSYSNGVYTIYVRNNAPFTSYILRAYYYTSSTFGWSWVNESVGPGAIVAINISTGPLQSPSFAIVTALGNVFTYKPAPPLPMPATYTGRIWGGDKYSYAGNTVVRTVSGRLFLWNSSSTLNPWSTSGAVSIVVSDGRYEISLSSGGILKYTNASWSISSAIVVVYLKYYPVSLQYPPQPFSPLNSQILTGLMTNPSKSTQNVPHGYSVNLTTYDAYEQSYLSIASARGSSPVSVYNKSAIFLAPYNYHVVKFTGIVGGSAGQYYGYLDGVLRSYHSSTENQKPFQGIYIYCPRTVAPVDAWYIAMASAYTNDTITVYNVPAGWKVEVIGTDAIGRPVFLEAINTATAPSTVTINIDNYYAPITGQLAVTP